MLSYHLFEKRTNSIFQLNFSKNKIKNQPDAEYFENFSLENYI